jgi:DNA-binding MarR family transcriptional regulator
VERRPHPSDRRADRLYLTPKGRATLERLAPLGLDISGEVLAGFEAREIRQMLQQLLRVKDNIRAAAETDGARRAANGGRHAG